MAATKPMLAGKCNDLGELNYPVLASPKIDGIRCWLHPEKGVVARSLKPIPNVDVQVYLSPYAYTGLDGELVTLDDSGNMQDYNSVQSEIMSKGKHIERRRLQLLVFDVFEESSLPFERRLKIVEHVVEELRDTAGSVIKAVPHTLITDRDEMSRYEQAMIAAGFEGVMVRALHGQYKSGRSTTNQGWLLKIKRFSDAEGTIVGIEPAFENNNERKLNELGELVRGHSKENKEAKAEMGKLILHTDKWGQVKVGTGFTAEQRRDMWWNQQCYIGKVVKFKYQAFGTQDKPRLPVFLGLRDRRDMS